MEIETNKMKRQCCSNHNTAKLVGMEDLPNTILVQILSKLPSKSLFCFGCVSKALSSTIDDQSLITLHNRLLADNEAAFEVPQLMSIAHKARSDVICTMQTRKCVRSSLKRGKYALNVSSPDLCFFFRNLFGFQLPTEHCFIVNPLRRKEVVRLPTSSNTQELTESSNPKVLVDCFYGMGVDKDTYKLKIVRVGSFGSHTDITLHKLKIVHVLELDEASWREISSVPPDDFSYDEMAMSACGDVHWFTQIRGRSCVLSFDFTKEEFSWTPMPPSLDLTNKIHLLTFRGALTLSATSSSVHTNHIEIWVLKDYERKVWTLDYAVDVDVFCDSHILEIATCGEWEHGIYFYYHRFYAANLGSTFLDLRSTPVRCFSPPLGRTFTYIVSYTGSLLSLKNYDNLVDANELVSD